jgi:hypothetical protein
MFTALCKKDYGFTALCSRVGEKHTYIIKIWQGIHNCLKTLNNRPATSEWISTKVVDKLMVQDKVNVKDIMTDLGRNHSVGVTFWEGM